MINVSDFPDSVLASEFPAIYAAKSQSKNGDKDKTNIFVDQDNGQFYLQKQGSENATRYNLVDANKSILRPKFSDNAHISVNQLISNWGSLSDDNIFDTTNKNWDEIRDYIQLITRKMNSMIDWINEIESYLDKFAEKKDIDLSEIISNQVDGYYKKSDVDIKINNLEHELENIQSKIQYKPNAGGVFPPSYTGDKTSNVDINDDITDPKTSLKIDELNNNIVKEGD
ncbi:hypothetical protein M5C72_07060 [Companilactobacillus allii]|uniref:Uncharacterized protein n=1 Tax=Companilactobacillus allii TaxID=1847728 RepID=A0A1P8Q4U5_9LACO|nr:hypothetical protein [Companilactobacillus allii]APX72855.1 hypothetical protein BTM29_09970 [Companilactobacillus allii]USQ67644.1 hypothetical protein M5C72_07060 [Companilactobacillus allii]